MNSTSPTVLIFRKQILPYSETFIADQGRFLTTFRPCFVGFKNTGNHSLLNNAPTCILEDYSRVLFWAKLKFRAGLPINRSWLESLEKLKPALIHAHFTSDALDAMILSENLNIPFIATAHGNDITKFVEPASYVEKRKRMFDKAGKIIAVSNFIREQLLTRSCPEEKIVQHYIGIDVKKFSGVKDESDEPSILFIGRLVEKKGCRYLLDAMAKINADFPGLALNIVGTGPLEKPLRQQAKQLGLKVNFLGSKSPDEIRELMLKSWVFSTPSITATNGNAEGLGMVFLEAQALQTPVASFKSGGVVEAVEHGKTGLLCDEKDTDSLAENLAFFLNDKQERINFGVNGRNRIVETFDISKQCQKLEEIYKSVLN